MFIQKIHFENYKSFIGPTELIVDPNITTIIGKNETGKSNVIDLIGSVSLSKETDKRIFSQWHRDRQNEPHPIVITLYASKEECSLLGLKDPISTITIDKESTNPKIGGSLTQYFEQPAFSEAIERFIENLVELNSILDSSHMNTLKTTFQNIKLCQNAVCFNHAGNIDTIRNSLNAFKETIGEENHGKMLRDIEIIEDHILALYSKIPAIFKYVESPLSDSYSLSSDFFEKYSTAPLAIRNFIAATKLPIETFKIACISPDKGLKKDSKDKIAKAVKEQIEIPFNRFYKQEKVQIVVDIEGATLNFLIETSNRNINLSERSNGLKWYLNLFIALKANDIVDKNVLYLIDEPGVYLHVDAQKYLLKLFDDLSNDNQIIFTTHSPFMIDLTQLERIRVITKQNNDSKIFTSIHNPQIPGSSKMETLSPISNAIGLSMASDLGLYSTPFSIITEGKLDHKYLCSMCTDLFNKAKIISCIGAPNIVNVATILKGWGCDFAILLDDDKEGRRIRATLGKKNFPNSIICMVSDALESKSQENYEIEDLIDPSDFSQLKYNYSSLTRENKTLAAIRFQEFVTSSKEKLSETTISNFKRLESKLLQISELEKDGNHH